MAWPRNGVVILSETDTFGPGGCTATIPTASCPPFTTTGSGGGGTTPGNTIVGNPLQPPLVTQTLFTNMNVLYHKINLELTKTNIYGEAIEKWYYQPIYVRCVIERADITNGDDEFGVTVANTIKITIPFALIQQYNFIPEVGDILMDRELYYEVNNVNQQFATIPGTNAPNSVIGTTGQIMAYSISGYLTRITKLNIIPYYQ
jgi:hypothetical protein